MHVRVAKRSTYVAHRNARNSILGHWWAHWRSRSRVQILRGSHHLPRYSARADRVLVEPPIPRHRARIPGLGIGSRHGCTVGVGGGSGGDIDMGFCTCCRILCEQRQVRRVKEQVCRRKVGRASSLGDTHVSVVHRERVTSTHDTTHDTHVADKRHSRMLPSVVAQRSIPTRHPVNTCLPVATLASRKKAGDMLSRCQLWYFPRHTPLGSSTMPGLADATDSAEWCARTRNSGGTTGNSCYKFISSKNAFGLDRTGLDWIRLDSTGSERPRDISEAGTFHLFFFLPYRGMILRVLAERAGVSTFSLFFAPFPNAHIRS